jgi:glutamine amidotransferase
MCRWITILASDELSLSDVVLAPANSLVQMSKDASFHPGYSDINNHAMNGDGFGVGWYHSNVAVCPTPDGASNVSSEGVKNGGKKVTKAAVFKDTQPAWNHTNLRELCLATRSDCIVAHVRAASKNTGVSTANCHPFKAGRLLFCHNGRVDSFIKLRRAMMNLLSDEAFVHVRGTTDSECVFALILTYLGDSGEASPITQTEPFGHKRLVAAIKKAFRTIEILVEEAGLNEGEHFSTCNFSLTDGDTGKSTCSLSLHPSSSRVVLSCNFSHYRCLHLSIQRL